MRGKEGKLCDTFVLFSRQARQGNAWLSPRHTHTHVHENLRDHVERLGQWISWRWRWHRCSDYHLSLANGTLSSSFSSHHPSVHLSFQFLID